MESEVQIKEEPDDEECLSLGEVKILDDYEGVMKCEFNVLKMNNLQEHCFHQPDMDDYTAAEEEEEDYDDDYHVADDIDIEESKDFIIEDFPLKHENATCYQDETKKDVDPLEEEQLNISNVTGNQNCELGLLKNIKEECGEVGDRYDLSQYDIVKIDNDGFLEQAEIMTKKSIDACYNSSLNFLEQFEVNRMKTSLQETVSKGFENIKQEKIDEGESSPPHAVDDSLLDVKQDDIHEMKTSFEESFFRGFEEQVDIKEIKTSFEESFFTGFENIGQDEIDIQRVFNDLLSNGQDGINWSKTLKIRLHEDLGYMGQDGIGRTLRQRVEKVIQNINYRNSRRTYVQQNVNNDFENIVIKARKSPRDCKNENLELPMVNGTSLQSHSLDVSNNVNGTRTSLNQRFDKEGFENMEQRKRTSGRETVGRENIVEIDEGRRFSVDKCSLDEEPNVERTSSRRKSNKGVVKKVSDVRKSNVEQDSKICHGKSAKKIKTLVCSVCNYKSPSNTTLKIHMRFHRGERTFKCKVCPKSFVTSSHLKRHMLSHNGVRNHVCVICTKRFLLGSHLQDHMRYHTDMRPFRCTLCTLAFTQSSNLKRHMATHADVQLSNPNSQKGKFECTICPKKFPYSVSLERHMSSHRGEKKYVCPVCSRRFAQSGTLERHQWTHKKDKPYKCASCSKSFTRRSCLIKHMKYHYN